MNITGAAMFLAGFAVASSAFGCLEKPIVGFLLCVAGAALMYWGLT